MKRSILVAIALFCVVPMMALAQDNTEEEAKAKAEAKKEELIANITNAYGGEALLKLSNYRISDAFMSPAIGQSHSPDLTEIGNSAQVLVIDLKNNRAAYDTWFAGRQGGFQNSTVGDGKKAYALNHQAGTYSDAANADPKVFAGGTIRTSDTALVYELNQVKEAANLAEDKMFLTRPHHVITMPFPSSPDLHLYVDAETFLVSRMQRINPQLGNLDYVYANHKQQKGITSASTINFSVAGVPNAMSIQHELAFDIDLADDTFSLPGGYSKEGERIDTSEMRVNKVSDNVYHIGQGGGYSLFVNTNIGIVAAGGYPALRQRFERFQSASDVFKPLTHQVVTHHHSDHLGGLAEAVSLGASLVTVSENMAEIQTNVAPSPDDRDFLSMSKRMTIGEGRNRVEVYEVSTSHAASFLVTYVPADKIVFIADHMGSPFAKATPVANLGTVTMLTALDALDIDIKKIATAHNARIFSMQDMRDSVAAYQPNTCAGGRPVCQ